MRAFFTTSTRNLLAAERDTRVEHDLAPSPETLRRYVRQLEADEGLRADMHTNQEREDIRALRKEAYELRRANKILKAANRLPRKR
jgi:transposase-like protein